jgi:hypothetical protein
MSDCCTPKGYRQLFSEKGARSQAKRYRRKGLDPTTRRLVELLKLRGLRDRTLLEVGGGIGAIQIELLKAGLSRAVSVELTPASCSAMRGSVIGSIGGWRTLPAPAPRSRPPTWSS